MKWKRVLVFLATTLLLIGFVVAQEENPVEGYFYDKILPFLQSLATIAAIAYMIYGATKLMQSDDPAEVEKGKKVVIGSALGVALVWLAPAIVKWLIP